MREKPILILLDGNFHSVGVIQNYISLIWHGKYMGYGDSELYIQADTTTKTKFQVNRYLYNPQTRETHIIVKTEIKYEAGKGRHAIITAYDVRWLWSNRVSTRIAGLSAYSSYWILETIQNEFGTYATYNRVFKPYNTNVTMFQLGVLTQSDTQYTNGQPYGTNCLELINQIDRQGYVYTRPILQIHEEDPYFLVESAHGFATLHLPDFNLYTGTISDSSEKIDITPIETTVYARFEDRFGLEYYTQGQAMASISRREVFIEPQSTWKSTWGEMRAKYPTASPLRMNDDSYALFGSVNIPILNDDHYEFLWQYFGHSGYKTGNYYHLDYWHVCFTDRSYDSDDYPEDDDSVFSDVGFLSEPVVYECLEELTGKYQTVENTSKILGERYDYCYHTGQENKFMLADTVAVMGQDGTWDYQVVTEVTEVWDGNGYDIDIVTEKRDAFGN